jgi:demethylmenaquinone methyltransferase / 2-methoxy-6-polyprenyl-1,4-benzoquinol methylase
MTKSVDFGFQSVPEHLKAGKVAQVFDSVARRYDVMNDLMSAGMHRLWKRFAVTVAKVRPGERVLDVATGSGDLARLLAPLVGANGQLWMSDINGSMLAIGRDRMLDHGIVPTALRCNAERLPFADNYFDCVSVAFGLRNMTDKDRALAEMCRVLRPGGRLLVLEFSRVWEALRPAYEAYSSYALPVMGRLVAGDSASYRYLAESIRVHPDQLTLKGMMERAGFSRVEYYNLSAGVVAVHLGYKY